ncbi:MAG: trigger factor [Proteobacteria bacterium]|nr:trigger factor [Pseudomonadota bacterium]
MSFTITHISPVQVKIDVQVPSDEVAASVKRVLQTVGRQARIAGFRKGKAPLHVIKRLYGDRINEDVIDDIVPRQLGVALQEGELYPLSQPQFDLGTLDESQDFSFSATFEVAPRLEALVTEGVTAEKFRLKVNEALIDAELGRMQSDLAAIRDLETPRAVAEGDVVRCELRQVVDDTTEGEPIPQQDFTLLPDRTPQGMIDALVGKDVGDKATFSLGEGGEATFACEILEHKERVLPQLDDEFAKDVGDYETLADLRADIEKRHLTQMEERESERLRTAVFDALCEQNPMELPPTLLQKQVDADKKRFASMMSQMLRDAGAEDDEAAGMQRDDAAFNERIETDAARLVHRHFLIEDIAQREKLEVTDADVDAWFAQTAESTGLPLPRIRAEYGKGERILDLKGMLLERKVFDFVLPLITIEEKDMPSQGDANDSPSDSPSDDG